MWQLAEESAFTFVGKKFLVVEDTPSNRLLIQTYLSKSGAKLLFSDNGVEALEIIEANPDIDLVIMDIRLPKLNGLMTTREIRKRNSHLPIIAQTAFAMQSDQELCVKAGCNFFIAKPYRRSELLQAINSLIKS
ncbi:MAG: response regulator [Bacteroidales bacterium]|nr:response regulator [Bacteroidales bacterium]